MEHVRDIAKRIVAEMQDIALECFPYAGEHNRRLAIIDYANAIKSAPYCSRSHNQTAIESAYVYAERAISLGIPEERMDNDLYKVRQHIVSRLRDLA